MFDSEKYLSVISIFLICFSLVISGIITYYLYNFLKQKSVASKVRKSFLIIIFSIIGLSFIFALTGTVIYQTSDISSIRKTYKYLIATNVISFLLSLIGIAILFIFVHNIAIKLTEDSILYLGEKIEYKNIAKIIIDPSNANLYINYKVSRTYKRIRYISNCSFKKLIIDNASKMNVEITNDDANKYFEKLTGKN
ncbi:hypothetical protein [Mycoplasma yeatsii]|uniref:Cellulose synthase/poly-beta-1,6-N-acetylglucosamine synthase-like glycosyltransferase n=1 Tax=Mycoplasma yeatsii TaxID=51365 RepID=A0ABU0NF41_9MOLU|nr:hypothetical protein [Mycoplasma yeatsii]MDQ0568070.1 cellulose synthase/poly-beta-1,6-N-acetylglucosamine synthase-like glycosyltransferase [Mycoplasma yeatsii]